MEIGSYSRLHCPDCAGELRLEPFTVEQEDGREYVKDGLLLCEGCHVRYPIEADTPVLLRFSTPFHDWFDRKHEAELGDFGEYTAPRGEARPGEEHVQETFTDEWDLTRDNELSFTFTQEQLEDLNRNVWLSHFDRVPEERPRTLLDVGAGIGMEPTALREVTGAEHVFGLELNLAILRRRPEFRRQERIDYVVASLFDLPFAPQSFDMVYCEGVLHHTYSTQDGFKSIASRVRPGGYQFVWVYGLEDHLLATPHWWHRRHHFVESISRPWISRSPRPIRNLIFKILTLGSYLRRWGPSHAKLGKLKYGDKWKPANTEHALRDWLSPRYAWRHGYNEVSDWFEGNGFRVVNIQSSHASRDLFGVQYFGVGMLGQKGTEPAPADARREVEEMALPDQA
jgi:SAM-dependent methyltransferase